MSHGCENEVARTTGKGTHYCCGNDDCDRTVLDLVQHKRVEHTEHGHDTMRRTLYCSNACLKAALERDLNE